VPAGSGVSFLAVELEQVARAFGDGDGGVRDGIAEARGEGFVAVVGEVVLIAEEQSLVAHHGGLDRLDHALVEYSARRTPGFPRRSCR